jgi:hypothetical protein
LQGKLYSQLTHSGQCAFPEPSALIERICDLH